eukprot:4418358-Karenia_brevis.AAC.1
MRPRAGQAEVEHAIPIQAPAVPMTMESQDRPFTSRDVYFRKTDFREYGYLPGCPGCDAARLGGPARNHSQACRDRIKKELEKTEEGKRRLEEAAKRKT